MFVYNNLFIPSLNLQQFLLCMLYLLQKFQADIKVFGRITICNAASDWPHTFLQPGCFCLHIYMVQLKGNVARARELPSSNHLLSIEWQGPLDLTL